MKRLTMFFVFLITAAMVLAACGGGGGAANPTGSSNTGSSGGASVTPGASGIKDASLLGKWISADGASGYNFKDDYSVVITSVGEDTPSNYNITDGGKGSGKVQIAESGGVVTWDYKITNDTLDMTTPDGRARKFKKTT